MIFLEDPFYQEGRFFRVFLDDLGDHGVPVLPFFLVNLEILVDLGVLADQASLVVRGDPADLQHIVFRYTDLI